MVIFQHAHLKQSLLSFRLLFLFLGVVVVYMSVPFRGLVTVLSAYVTSKITPSSLLALSEEDGFGLHAMRLVKTVAPRKECDSSLCTLVLVFSSLIQVKILQRLTQNF